MADSGQGIAAEHLSQIFERFRQVDTSSTREHTGLGLGLAIARRAMEMHGGQVKAALRRGGGLEVLLTLPLHGA